VLWSMTNLINKTRKMYLRTSSAICLNRLRTLWWPYIRSIVYGINIRLVHMSIYFDYTVQAAWTVTSTQLSPGVSLQSVTHPTKMPNTASGQCILSLNPHCTVAQVFSNTSVCHFETLKLFQNLLGHWLHCLNGY